MKWFVACRDEGEIRVLEFGSREDMLRAVEQLRISEVEILCVWAE